MTRPSTRPPIARLHWWDAALRENRYPTIAECMERFEISTRTAYRDLDYLRYQMNAPLAYDRQRRGYCYTDPGFSLPAVRLSDGEIIALFLAEKILKQYRGTPYADYLREAFDKIRAALPDEVSLDPSGLSEALSFDLGPARPVEVDVFQTLLRAVRERRSIDIVYFSQARGVETERRVDPLHLHAFSGDWYLIAFCHLRGEVRDFARSRIRRLEGTDERFSPPAGFDRDAYLGQAFGLLKGGTPQEVAVWFDAYQARWVRERQWHPTQVLEEQPGGALILRMTVPVTDDVLRWVLSYGSHCRVLAPAELQAKVRDEVEKMRAGLMGS